MGRHNMIRDYILIAAILLIFTFSIYRMLMTEYALVKVVRKIDKNVKEDASKQFDSVRWYINAYDEGRSCNIDSSLMVSGNSLPIAVMQYRYRQRRAVPKIIHQTWSSLYIPAKVRKAVESWQKLNPDWEYWLWTTESINIFVRRSFPQYTVMFQRYTLRGQVINAAKALILYRYGGVFADIDVVNMRPLNELIQSHTCVLAHEHPVHANLLWGRDRLLSNAFMASTPSHPFMKMVAKELARSSRLPNKHNFFDDVMSKTGQILLDRVLVSFYKKYKTRSSSWYGHIYMVPPESAFTTFDEEYITESRCNEVEISESRREICQSLRENQFKNPTTVSPVFVDHLTIDSWTMDQQSKSDLEARFGDTSVYLCKVMKTIVVPGGLDAIDR